MSRKLHVVTDAEVRALEANNREQDNERRERKRSKLSTVPLIVALMLVLLALAAVVYFGSSRTFDKANLLTEVTFKHTGELEVYAYEDGFMHVTKDGAEALDAAGKKLWNVSFDMKSPIAKVCKTSAAIADKGNRKLYICDGTGTVNRIETPYPIVDVDVSEGAIASVWADDGANDHIYLYDIAGTMLLDIMTTSTGNGFPLDIALSPDGRKLATSYINIKDGQTTSWITFYNFGGVGQSYVDKIVGTFSYENDFAPFVDFVGENKVAVTLEEGVDIYSYKELPELSSRIYPENKIKSIFFDKDEYVGFVLGESETVEIYSLSGSKKESFELTLSYDGISANDGNIFIFGSFGYKVYANNGTLRYESTEDRSITDIVPTSSKRFILKEDNRIKYVELN